MQRVENDLVDSLQGETICTVCELLWSTESVSIGAQGSDRSAYTAESDEQAMDSQLIRDPAVDGVENNLKVKSKRHHDERQQLHHFQAPARG